MGLICGDSRISICATAQCHELTQNNFSFSPSRAACSIMAHAQYTKVCGNPSCHCARDPAARHEPYYEWSYLKDGRLRHRTLTPKQAELMRLAIANYRKAKKLVRTWEAHTQRLIELNAPE